MSYHRSAKHLELFRPGNARVWWAFLPNPGGGRKLRKSTGHTDEKAAYLWYLEVVRSSGRTGEAKEETTLGEALKRRRDERRAAGRTEATIGFLEKKGRQLIRVIGKNTILAAIDARTVDAYVARRLRGDGEEHPAVSHSSVHKELITLRGALKLARRQGYACKPVEEVMPLDFSPRYKPRERALSMAEIEALLKALPLKRAAIIAFIIATAATYPSELASLRRSDVDQKAGYVRLRGTKRATRDRKVPIVDFARDWIKQAMAYYPFEPWGNIRRDLHLACDQARIPHCSPNDLRRTMLTLLRARGVEPQLLAAFAGHADGRMAERVYGRLAPEALAHLLAERLAPGANRVQTKRQNARKAG